MSKVVPVVGMALLLVVFGVVVVQPAGGAGSQQAAAKLLASSPLLQRHVAVPSGSYGSQPWGSEAQGPKADVTDSCPWPPASESPPSYLTSPVDGATIATVTPVLMAYDITGGTGVYDDCYEVAYRYKVTTSPGGGETVADSGWQTSNDINPISFESWTVPEGALRDGETYYVAVQSDDTELLETPLPATTITDFTVNLREGAGGPSPTDTVGSTPSSTSTPAQGSPSPGLPPASETVNLLTGSLALSASTHSMRTLSGSAGVSLNYDSLDADLYGLDAQYYVDTGDHDFSAADTLMGQKTDPQIEFNWNGVPPIGALPLTGATGWLVKWTGTIYIPEGSSTVANGNWAFGVQSPGGMRVCIDQASACTASNATVNEWTEGSATNGPVYGATIDGLTEGPHSITVETYTGNPGVTSLWIKDMTSGAPQPTSFIVPSSWLTSTPASLPAGWSLSAQTYNAAWTGLVDDGSQVVLTSSTGSTADFLGTGGSGQSEVFTPPPGDTDLLTRNANGTLKLTTQAGDVYTFTLNGLVSSITTSEDATGRSGTSPDSLQYTYSGSPLQLTAITDPVSGRAIALSYNGNGTCPTDAANGVTLDPPVDMLCAISYWDGTQSTFAYNSEGELAQVDNLGAVSLFAYDGVGRLDFIQDPLAYAAIQAGERADCPASATSTPTCDTTIGYLVSAASCAASFTPSCAQVATVTQPSPTYGAAQPERSYCYADSPAASSCNPTASTTTVSVAGFTPSSGFENEVAYNSSGEVASETSSVGLTQTAIWSAAGLPLVEVQPNGEQTTYVYNNAGEVTDKYGPALSACFSATAPYLPVTTGYCSLSVLAPPHTHYGYDEGITGPETGFWSNSTLSGPPCQESTGLGTDTTLYHVWGSTVPACASSGNWSLQMTGLVDFPTAGTWTFQFASQSALAVSLNGVPLGVATGSGAWGTTVTATASVVSPGWEPIVVDYLPLVNPTGSESNGFSVSYQPPGGSSTVVPYSAIDPAYGLKTSTIDPDGKVTISRYVNTAGGIDPIDGLVTQTVEDPSTAVVAADGLPSSLGDPSGLSLTTTTGYEAPSASTYFRKTSSALPDGATTTYSYYSGTAGPIAAVCGVSASTPQGGQLEQQTDPASGTTKADMNGARTQEFVYTAAGQEAGVRVSDVKDIASAGWQCMSYSSRGLLTTQTWPAVGSAAARTVTYTYAVGGNPLVSSVSDSTGTITDTVDLEGRVVSYTDALGQTTTSTYDQAGQLANTSSPVTGEISNVYDQNSGQLTAVYYGFSVAATATYWNSSESPPLGAIGQLDTVRYGNGIEAEYGYNYFGAEDGVSYVKVSSGSSVAS